MSIMAAQTIEYSPACHSATKVSRHAQELFGQQKGRPLNKPDRFSLGEIKSLQALHPEFLRQRLLARGKQSRDRANGRGLY